MILASDTFNRISGTLGGSWTEHGLTNMSCDGSFARIDASGQAHLATLVGTSQRDTYFQCWMQGGDSANAQGLIWRFQDTSNYYLLRWVTSWGVFRVEGGVATPIGATFTGSPTTFKRLAIRHVGTRIQIYLDQNYDTVREGPVFDSTDTDAQGQLWTGPCGIQSGSNTAAGVTNLKWNDFIAFDGGPQTIYVDTLFNGGVAGEGMGTEDRPDLHIDWALNNAGLNRGGKLKFLQDGPITNPTAGQFKIGHAGKFGAVGWSFPTYDPENGSVVSEGAPNLIIEGRDGGRTILREVRSPAENFFRFRDTATGVVFRSLDFELPDSSSKAVRTQEAGAITEHSIQLAKCTATLEDPSGTLTAFLLESTTAALKFECFFCFFDCDPAADNHGEYIRIERRIQQTSIRFNVFRGLAGSVPGAGAEISYCVVFDTTSDLQAADTADIDHNTFIDIFRLLFNEATVGFLQAANMAGTVEYQNNLVRGPGSAAPDQTTDFAIYTAGTTPAGSITSHHNGYFQVTTARDGGVTDGGNEIEGTDPQFLAEATPFVWQHTQGHGLNGEGTSAAITLPGDYRPGNAAYIDTADDSTPNLGILDRGALQGYVPVSMSLPEPEEGREPAVFCASVIFDPGGPQQFDLSSLVLQGTALRYERDILLRSYRASDVTIEFVDVDGLFVESNPDSFLLGADGEPDWLGKRVLLTAAFGAEPLAQYEGFVLEVEASAGKGMLRIGNRFQQLFDRNVHANDVVRIVATNNQAVHPRFTGDVATAGYPGRDSMTLHLDARPPVEVLTIEFRTPSGFFATGSVSGYEGEGSIDSEFTTLSGSLTIEGGDQDPVHSGTAITGDSDSIVLDIGASGVDDFYNGMTIFLTGGTGAGQVRIIVDYAAISFPFNRIADVDQPWTTIPDNTTTFEIHSTTPPWNGGAHTYAIGEKVRITLGWSSTVPLSNPPSNDPNRRILDIYRDFLLSAQGGQLVATDLDDSVGAMETERGNQMARPYVVDQPRRAIDVVDELSLHMGAVTIEKSNAKIGLRKFTPQLIAPGSLEVMCHADDLVSLETAHLPIYNQFVFSFEYDVATNEFLGGFVFPSRREDNRSLERYDRLYPAPRTFEARAYSIEISDNSDWLELLAAILYRRYENPSLVARVSTKISRMGAELDDTYRVDSEAPPVQVEAMEPFAIDKNAFGNLRVDMELVDVSAIVQEIGACGFLSYDTPGQGYDDCWGYF